MRQRTSMFEVAALLDETIEKGEKVGRLAEMSLADLVLEHRRICKSMRVAKSSVGLSALGAARDRIEHLIRKSRGPLNKSISFNPLEPHDMNSESSYYSPYRQLSDGSYAPHATEHWMQQEPSLFLDGEFGGRRLNVGGAHEEAVRRDGYTEVDRFYVAAGVRKSDLYAVIDDLVKALPAAPKPPSAPSPSGKMRGLPVGTVHTWNGQPFRKVSQNEWQPVTDPKAPHPIEQDAQAKQAKLQQIIEDRKAGKAPEPSFEDRARVATAKHNDISTKEAELEKRDREAKDRDHDHRERDLGDKEKKLGDQQKEIEQHQKRLEEHSKKAPLEHQFVSSDTQAALEKKIARRPAGQGQHVKLTKAELAHTLKNGKYSLISAGKNQNHPADAKLDDKAIKKRNDVLEKELKEAGYAYTRIKGHYGGEEDSFLVMVHEADKNHMTALGKRLNQDSIIYAENGKQEMIYTTGDKAGKKHVGEGFEEKPDAEDYFSEIDHGDGSKTKFSLKFDWDNLKNGDDAAKGKESESKVDNDEGPSPAKADKGKPRNNMGPPPPEHAAFQKPGKELDVATVDKFIKAFQPDFDEVSQSTADLRSAGATGVSTRLKAAKSLHNKMQKRFADRSLDTVGDVIGMRALSGSAEDQKKLLAEIKKRFKVFSEEDTVSNPRDDGYRAIHLGMRTASGKMIEVQVKTENQHAWAEYSHSRIYKPEETIEELNQLNLDPKEQEDLSQKISSLKTDPEVNKYMKALSDHLYEKDSGKEAGAIPEPPQILKEISKKVPGMLFEEPKHNTQKSDSVKYFVIEHDENDKPTAVHEFNSLGEATKGREKIGDEATMPIAHAASKEELFRVWPDFKPMQVKGKKK